ncbi:MAG: thioredoxin fold domain-containing protein [Bacteroidota bacterium]
MIKRFYILIGCLVGISFSTWIPLQAQEVEAVHWLSFEELEDSLATNPKKVFIDFYTDWCTYCRKMDKVVFTNSEVINILNETYYAVRFNAESDSSISFGGQVFTNEEIGRSRNPIHQITQLLAVREGKFVAPTLVFLDEEFRVKSRYFAYMDSRKLIKELK